MPRPLRILHVLADAPGGSREYVRRLVAAADPARVRPVAALLAARHGGTTGLTTRLSAAAVRVGCPPLRLGGANGILGRLRTIQRLRRQARQADVVVTHAGEAGLLGRLAAWWAGRPVVHVAHNWPGLTPGSRWRRMTLAVVEVVCGLRTALAVAPSRAVLCDGREHHWMHPGRAVVVRHGIDLAEQARRRTGSRTAARQRLGLAPTVPVLLFAGRFDPVKNAPGFVRLAAALAQRHAGLVALVAGDGTEARAVQEAATDVRAVQLLGWREDVPLLCEAADVLVVPSHSEALGIVVLEALAAGTPVVATRVGGLPEAVGPGGVLVQPGDDAALATAVSALLADHRRRAHLAALGARWVERVYAGDRWAGRHERLWRRVAGWS